MLNAKDPQDCVLVALSIISIISIAIILLV